MDASLCVSVAPAHLCEAVSKRGRMYICDCGVTHSCTAFHAFSANSCCTASRWRSWRRSLAQNDARCCCCCRSCTLSLSPPCLSPSAALFLGSYPGEKKKEKQTHRAVFKCKCCVFSFIAARFAQLCVRTYNRVCVRRLKYCECHMHTSKVFTCQDLVL